MGNNQCFKFKDLSITSAKLPFNAHLIWEVSSSLIFMVDSTNQLVLLKSVDKGANWTTVTTRNHKIQAGYPDGTYIWLVDCDNDGVQGDYDAWKITTDGNDTITSISTVATNGTPWVWDVFKIGTNTYAIDYEDYAANYIYHVWDVDTDPAVDKANWNPTFNSLAVYQGVVVGNKYHTIVELTGGLLRIVYDDDVPSLTSSTGNLVGYTMPAGSQKSISYDGSDLLYFIATKTADGKDYLVTISTTGDTWNVLSEYNIALMLDRNCAETVPNELEKAFDVAKDADNNSRIWEIKPKKGGLIQLQTIEKNANIIAITDNFIMFGGGEMYEYTDVLADNTIAEGFLNAGIFPIPTKAWFNCHPDDATLFYTDDSIKVYDDTDELILFAKITDKSRNENGIYEFGLGAYSNELWRRSYVKSHSANKTSDKLKDNVDNNCSFCHRDSSIYSGDATNYSYEQDRPSMAMFDYARFMERIVGSVKPNGLVRTELYNSLTKAPQYYPATYGFREDDVGDVPAGWTANNGASCSTRIVASISGHKKVLDLYDNNAGAYFAIYQTFTAGGQDSGTIEFWVYGTDVTKTLQIWLTSSGTQGVRMQIAADKIQYHYAAAWHDATGGGLFDAILYRFKIVFDSTADTYDFYLNGTVLDSDIAYSNVTGNIDKLEFYSSTADTGYHYYITEVGYDWDANYNIGDNLVAWDVEINGKIELIDIGQNPSYYPKKLGITRATCVGAAGVSQTYSDASLEDGKAIIPLKEYRDLKIRATTEALQVATALFNLFSQESKFIGLRVVNQEYVRCGNTVNFANTGDVTVAEGDYLVLYYEYDWVNDVYDLMVLTDNVLLLREMESYFDRGAVMVHQNSTAVRENQVSINTKPTFYTDAGDPTINDDTDLGYEVGDLWLNTTDKGLFVCCDNADGAADWDEITKA